MNNILLFHCSRKEQLNSGCIGYQNKNINMSIIHVIQVYTYCTENAQILYAI
jgi:hypothetical protein